MVTGSRGGSYEVNKFTGNGFKTNNLTSKYYFNAYDYIEDEKYLQSNPPLATMCPPIAPCVIDNFYPLDLTVQNHKTGEETTIYSKRNSGNLAKGRYIGDKFYSIPMVPALDHWLFIMVLSLFVLLMSYRKLINKF